MKIITCDQYSDEWWAHRLGKPSASCAKKIITSTGKPSKSTSDYACELANDLYVGKVVDDWGGNKATERGTEMEDQARSMYSLVNNCVAEEIGMFMDDDETYLASPDGVIGEDGLLEIKCLTAKHHTKALIYYAKNRRPPTDYIAQCQFQLLVSGYKYVDLFFYHPDLPVLTVRILPIKTFFEMALCQIEAVIEERDAIVKILEAA